MNTIAMKYGLLGTGIGVGIFVTTHGVLGIEITHENYTVLEIIGYLTLILATSMVVLGMKKYRDEEAGGQLRYWTGVRLGVLITLLPSFGVGVFTGALFYAKPDMGERFMDIEKQRATKQIEENLSDPAEIEAAMQTLEAKIDAQKQFANNPFLQAALMFVTTFLVGLIVSLIAAAIISRGSPRAA